MAAPKWFLAHLLEEPATANAHGITREALHAIDAGVVKCTQRLSELPDDKQVAANDELAGYVEATVADECDIIEALLGCGFVTAQAQIAYVVSRVEAARGVAESHCPGSVTSIPARSDKSSLLKINSRTVGSSAYTQMEFINEVANYFKHRDEWPTAWANIKTPRRTQQILINLGLSHNSTGNLRSAAELVGNKNYDKSTILLDILTEWHSQLMKSIKKDLEAANFDMKENDDPF